MASDVVLYGGPNSVKRNTQHSLINVPFVPQVSLDEGVSSGRGLGPGAHMGSGSGPMGPYVGPNCGPHTVSFTVLRKSLFEAPPYLKLFLFEFSRRGA